MWERQMARTPSSFLMIAPIPRGWGSLITRQVLWCNPRAELVGQAPAYGFVERPIVGAEVRFTGAMQEVVEALGEGEEASIVRPDNRPFCAHPELAQERDDYGHHLCHSTAMGGRVHHPDGAAVEAPYHLCGRVLEFVHGRRQLRVAAIGRERMSLFDGYQIYHGVLPSKRLGSSLSSGRTIFPALSYRLVL